MAKEWYLLNSNHDYVSGFESEDFDNCASDAFLEALNSSLGSDVELCNYDLSECTPMRAIIQGNVQDTQLNSTQRRMLVPIGTCHAGMYVKYKDRYWLIIGFVDDNHMYEKAILYLCNYQLTWINEVGKIIQRWCRLQSASQYNNGETSNANYSVRSDQLMVYTPDDTECLSLDSGKRFIIDKRCGVYEKSFDETVVQDTSKPVTTYELTRADSVLYDYQGNGFFAFMAYQDEQHSGDGYYLIDGRGYWLCDGTAEEETQDKTAILSSEIQYDSLEIFDGLEASVFTACFYDENGNKVNTITPTWEVKCDFADKLMVEYVDNSVMISVDNTKLVNNSFELLLSGEGYETKSVTITIKAFI